MQKKIKEIIKKKISINLKLVKSNKMLIKKTDNFLSENSK